MKVYSPPIMDNGRMLTSQSHFSPLDLSYCLGSDSITTASTAGTWAMHRSVSLSGGFQTVLLIYCCLLIKNQDGTILKWPALGANKAFSLRSDYFHGVVLTTGLCLNSRMWNPSLACIYHFLHIFGSGSASLHGSSRSCSLLVSKHLLIIRTRLLGYLNFQRWRTFLFPRTLSLSEEMGLNDIQLVFS